MSGLGTVDCTYAPGDWAVVAGPSSLVLANALGDPATIAGIWDAVVSAGPFDVLLATLSSAGGVGVEDFVVLHYASGFSRAAVRGSAVLEIVADGIGITLRCPPGTRTWLETPLAGELQSVRMANGEGRPDGALSLPLRDGVALGGEVVVRFGGSSERGLAPERPEASAEPEPPPVSLTPPPAPPAPVAATEPVAGPELHAGSDLESDAEQESREAEASDGGSATLLGDVGDDASAYDFLTHTVGRPPVDDVVVHVLPDGGAEEHVESGEDDGAGRVAAPTPEPPEPDAGSGWQPPSLISAVPGIASVHPVDLPPVAAAPGSPPAVPGGGAEDHTIDLRTAREMASRIGQQGAGPVVLSVRCPNDHLNPPHATQCRYPHCRAAITSTRNEDAPRPPLGVLRLTTGDTIVLDRDVILGRSPDEPIDDGPDSPHVIRLDSPTGAISRNHVRVTLDGWHVMVTDLRSMNGTEMAAPGQQPQQLRGGEAVPILPGTSVILAEDVTFVYEVE